MRYCWDVRKAKEILKSNNQLDVQQVDIDLFNKLISRSVNGKINIGVMVVWNDGDREKVDLTFPIIIVQHPKLDYMLIDGWHRVYHAAEIGMKELPGVCLSKKDSNAIIMK
jgi:hypothetical protein